MIFTFYFFRRLLFLKIYFAFRNVLGQTKSGQRMIPSRRNFIIKSLKQLFRPRKYHRKVFDESVVYAVERNQLVALL